MTGIQQRHAAVLGHPIQHSLSPVIHRAAYTALGIDDIVYDALDVNVGELPDVVARCAAAGWLGLSLTMPLKEAVLPLLDRRTPTVELAQAANTVLFREDGLHGHNTDVPGMVAALQSHGVSSVPHCTLIGAGATARSAVVALTELGATSITVAARRPEAAAELAGLAQRLGLASATTPLEAIPASLDGGVVISTLPADGHASLLPWARRSTGLLFDVLYDPWPTPLAAAWQGSVIGGLELLVQQGALQVELMLGQPAPVGVMRGAAETALADRRQA